MLQGPVLLVDDEPQVRSLVRAVLSKHGFQIVEADDGLSAWTTVQELQGAISLIVSDYSMPRLNGAALASRAKRNFPPSPYSFSRATRMRAIAFPAMPFLPSLLCRPYSLKPFIAYAGRTHRGNYALDSATLGAPDVDGRLT